ncbi:MAG: hypothetical protein R3253_11555 [Longimicrobiales bacterium]|nr:hypothetical protein [Longimicrobiales bacterium]
MSDPTVPPTEETPVRPMLWPPPGLARIQGDLWIVARKMAVVATALVVPLLVVIGLPHSPYGLGPLGEAWWLVLLTTILGVALFTDAVVTLVRFLGRVRRALAEGYTKHVVALVVSDRDRDNGFLLQGVNAFSVLSQSERRTLGRLRFLAPLGYLVGATWFVVGFGILLFLAARGWVSPTGLGFGTIAPAVFIWFFGLVLRATEGTLAYRAREAWHRNDWAEDLARHEIESWQDASEDRGFVPRGASVRGAPIWPSLALVGVVVGSLAAVVPAMTLVPASSIGAILGSIGGWSYERTLLRGAEAEAYRPYRVDPDSTVTAIRAGELLHSLARAGLGPHDAPEFREPVESFEEPWIAETPPEGFRVEAAPYWSDTSWTWVERGLSAEESEFLRSVAEHPAREHFSTLASATALDFVGAYYRLPFDADDTYFSLPIPRTAGLRSAAHSHLALAALHAAAGRHDEAQQTVREVISVGFLLTDKAPSLLTNLVGSILVRVGGDALASAYAVAGDVSEAEALRAVVQAAEAASERMAVAVVGPRPGGDDFLEHLPRVAEDPRALPGLRWEAAHLVTVFTPCANLRRVVFGPDEEYYAWMDRVRASLVDFPAEEAYFEVAMRGISPLAEPGFLSRAVTMAMGRADTPGSCAQMAATLPSLP